MKRNITSRACLYFSALFLVCAGLAGGWALGLQIVGNIHPVEEGSIYRAAQLNDDKLAQVIAAYGIKSVINLRGENRGVWWYDNEITVTAAHGASHFDVRMSALHEPDDTLVTKLIETLRSAPRPILVHCNSGSDRTGLASALYERFIIGRSAEVSARQISFRYGHFPWLGSRTVAMDQTFWRLSDQDLPNALQLSQPDAIPASNATPRMAR
jgi:protein tyrosine/serine phosphatase